MQRRGQDRTTPQRKTIALLLDYMTFTGGAYEAVLRRTFHAQAMERDLDLLILYGRSLHDSDPEAQAHNAIFELLSRKNVDGVIAVATSLSAKCGSQGLAEFLQRLTPLPICSIGVDVPGVPTVTIDNYTPMRSLVEHLIESHGKRRIAFLCGTEGNRESDTRFAAFRDALASHHVPFDERLVANGDFLTWSARAAMQRIVDQTRDFDAVVAANDNMAIGAIETLRRNGFHVPRDVAVTGFDDLAWACFGNPPLSTVAQPLDAIAGHAFDVVLSLLSGEHVTGVTMLRTEPVIRRSCGCERQPRLWSDDLDHGSALQFLSRHAAEVQAKLQERLQREGLGRSFDVARLVRPLIAELAGEVGAFRLALDDLLEPLSADIERCRACQEALSHLRDWLRPVATSELDDLLFAAFDRVAASLAGTQVGHQLQTDNRYLELLNAAERVSVALDESSLRDALAIALPAVGARTAFVSVLDHPNRSVLRPLVCLLEGELQDDVEPHDVRQLLPDCARASGERQTLAMFPLTIDSELHGLMAFAYERDAHGYSTIRDNICAALRSIRLHEELVAKTRLHERSIQERQATTKRIQSLSVLAGGVAHDLNNALGPLVALPELILQRLATFETLEGSELDKSRLDLQTIQTAAQRAVQTIRDLLTLGRQGRVQKEQLDLGRTVASAVLHGGSAAGPGTETRVSLQAVREPLPVNASEAHLVRAISNLIQNAIESQSGGTVTIRTTRRQLTEPLQAYEVVEPGDYGVVSVSDEGTGIAEERLPRIFEPFFSTKKLGERSGSGLGLAIVHGVTKEHGGFVDVTSTEGSGTTFTLYFPLVAPLAKSDRPPKASQRGNARVLVLDDDPIQRRLAQRILEHMGYGVDVVGTGAEAVELCVQNRSAGAPYDLLMLDVVLNEVTDGVEWFERIRERIPEQRALLVSGHMPTSRVERAIENGLGWLAKPYTADALAGAVALALAPRQHHAESPEDPVGSPALDKPLTRRAG